MSSRLRQGLVFLAVLPSASLLVRALPASAEEHPVSTMIFGSADVGQSTFLAAGAKIAIDDLDREGFVALIGTGGGARQERGIAAPGMRAPTFWRTTVMGAALGGYQFFHNWGVIGLFAGPEGTMEMLEGHGLWRALPARFGLRLQGELWMRTSPDTLATVTLILGSARSDIFARASAGFRAWDAYLGPEIAYYGDRTGYQKLSVGLHATDFALGPMSLRVGAGILYETQTARLGPYLALAAWGPFSWRP